jgi:hypothetical protein|tara:strand:- start:1011 stop:1247 length:237 start_codon:yes stop_codon:yes gene_type:complete
MAQELSKVVNAGFEGEPEHIVFQIQSTLQKIEPTEILKVVDGSIERDSNMPNDMWEVVNRNNNHECNIDLETQTLYYI